MQRLSTISWILLGTSQVHAQSSDKHPPHEQLAQQASHGAPVPGSNAVLSPMTPQPPDTPRSPRRKLVGAGLVAGGVVMGIGVGTIVGLGARSTYDEARMLCGADLKCGTPATFERGQHLVSSARMQAAVSTVAVAAGGAAVVTGLIVWLTAPKKRQTETMRIVPIVTAKDVALAITGGF